MHKKSLFRSAAGFSVIELLIILVVIGIVVTLAVIGLGASASSLARQNIAREFKVALERARYDSVKRRPNTCAEMSRVEITSATSFRLLTDTNRNGSIEPASETSLYDFATRSSTEIVGDGITYPITIRFDGRGNSSSGTCASPTAAYASTTFCELPCTAATAGPDNASIIYVSPTGTTTALLGGETIPDFDEPSVTSVTPSLYVNPLLSVWDVVTTTPTPASTPTSTPTSTPEDPPPTEESPTPTPTPRDCDLNEKPGTPPVCTCRLPWLVGHNGKCQP